MTLKDKWIDYVDQMVLPIELESLQQSLAEDDVQWVAHKLVYGPPAEIDLLLEILEVDPYNPIVNHPLLLLSMSFRLYIDSRQKEEEVSEAVDQKLRRLKPQKVVQYVANNFDNIDIRRVCKRSLQGLYALSSFKHIKKHLLSILKSAPDPHIHAALLAMPPEERAEESIRSILVARSFPFVERYCPSPTRE